MTSPPVLDLPTSFLPPCPSSPTPALAKIACPDYGRIAAGPWLTRLLPFPSRLARSLGLGPQSPGSTLHVPVTLDAGEGSLTPTAVGAELRVPASWLRPPWERLTGAAGQRPVGTEATFAAGGPRTRDRLGLPLSGRGSLWRRRGRTCRRRVSPRACGMPPGVLQRGSRDSCLYLSTVREKHGHRHAKK